MSIETENRDNCIPLSIIDKPDKTPLSRMLVSISIGGKDGLNIIKYILKNEKNFNINEKGEYWTYLLHYSIVMREEEIGIFLIDQGADVNLLDTYECSPLNYAVSKFEFRQVMRKNRENIELKKLTLKLILMGADISHANPVNGMFPYTEAIKNDYYFSYNQIQNRMDKIIKDKLNYPKEWSNLESWLKEETINGIYMDNMIKASMTGDENLTLNSINESIKNRGVGIIHGLDSKGQTLLHYSVNKKMKKVSEKLIKMGVDYNKRSIIGFTIFNICLNYPTKKEGQEMMNFLLEIIRKTFPSKIPCDSESDNYREKIINDLIELDENSKKPNSESSNYKKKQKRKEKKIIEAEERRLKQERKLDEEKQLEATRKKTKSLEFVNNILVVSKLKKSFTILKSFFQSCRDEEKRKNDMRKHIKKREKKMKINDKNFFFDSELNKDFWNFNSM
tara:strand:- start:642 stop:1988 length:1347 start_codon:yes stop_codon:yes gene_type:complete